MLTGCISILNKPVISESSGITGSVVVAPENTTLSTALARYAQGLIFEGEDGADSSRALEAYRRALEADPGNHVLASHVAITALHRNAPQIAIEVIESSQRVDPGSYPRNADLAAVYQATGRFAEAIDAYRKALQIDATPTAIYIALAGLLFRADRDSEALTITLQGTQHALEPALISVFLYDQARRFILNNALEKAVPCLEQLKDHDDVQRCNIVLVLADLYVALKNEPAAIQLMRNEMTRPEPPPEIYLALAQLLSSDHPDQAVRVLDDASHRFSDQFMFLIAIAGVYSDMRRDNDVINLLEASRRLTESLTQDGGAPALPESYYLLLASAYERMAQTDKAEALLDECITRFPYSHRALNFIAFIWAEQNRNLDKALTHSVRSLTLSPENGAYTDTLGWIYYRLNKNELALETITRALSQTGDDPEILLHLGDLHAAMGNMAKAISFWKKSVQLDGGDGNRALQQLRLHDVNAENGNTTP